MKLNFKEPLLLHLLNNDRKKDAAMKLLELSKCQVVKTRKYPGFRLIFSQRGE